MLFYQSFVIYIGSIDEKKFDLIYTYLVNYNNGNLQVKVTLFRFFYFLL